MLVSRKQSALIHLVSHEVAARARAAEAIHELLVGLGGVVGLNVAGDPMAEKVVQ